MSKQTSEASAALKPEVKGVVIDNRDLGKKTNNSFVSKTSLLLAVLSFWGLMIPLCLIVLSCFGAGHGGQPSCPGGWGIGRGDLLLVAGLGITIIISCLLALSSWAVLFYGMVAEKPLVSSQVVWTFLLSSPGTLLSFFLLHMLS